jgi:hypothetical protein
MAVFSSWGQSLILSKASPILAGIYLAVRFWFPLFDVVLPLRRIVFGMFWTIPALTPNGQAARKYIFAVSHAERKNNA